MMILAHAGKLDDNPDRYESYVYPRQLDDVLDLEIARIHGRIEALRQAPMDEHKPAPELDIPPELRLGPWPAVACPPAAATSVADRRP